MRRTWTRACVALVAICAFAAPALSTGVDDGIPLANWAAPPYWMAPRSESPTPGSKHLLAISNPSLAFHAVTPCRLADTRGPAGPYGAPSLTANAPRSFVATALCGIPAGIAAVSFNFAVVNMSANGNLVVYPTGAPVPSVSSLNWTPSEIAISNAAVIGLGSNSITVVVNGAVGSTTDLIIDVNGYYAADPVVTSLNGNSGALNLVASGDVTVNPGAPNTTIGTNAVSANTADTLVRRDASGNFAAGTITGTLNGTASGFSGSLGGDVTGTQGATVVSSVGGSSAANVHAAELLANAATSTNTANALVRRDALGGIVAGKIQSDLGFVQPGINGETLKVVRGIVHGSDGVINSGTGFTVTRNSAGNYTISMQSDFLGSPAVALTPLHTAGLFWWTTAQGNHGFSCQFVTPAGVPVDPTYFNFVLVGPPL